MRNIFVKGIVFAHFFYNELASASSDALAGDDHSDDHAHHDHSDEYGQVLLYFFTLGLGLGAVTDFLLSRFGIKVAFTLVMYCEGILFAILLNNTELNDFTESIDKWAKIPPYLVMYIFLPVLTFSDALELPWVEIKHVYKQSVFLAFPLVVIVTCTLGGILKAFTDWGWPLCLLFGACLSATDPVSVVPVMKTTGASHALTMLILGESIVSEGAATVLFHLFEDKVEGEAYSKYEVSSLVVREFVFSLLAGVFGGIVAVWTMSFANRHLRAQDSVLQVGLSLVCAYFTFYCSQSLFELSGVLAVCAAGVYVATFGEKVILSHHSFHAVWHLVEWAASTLLFLLAGLIVKDRTKSLVTLRHVGIVLLLFVAMVSVRGVFVLLSYRFIGAVSGHKITLKEAFFLGITGLRGAMGMILSLVVYGLYDTGSLTKDESSDFLVYSSLLIALSMLCGGILTRYFVKTIGLRPKESPESIIVKRYIRSTMCKSVVAYYEAHSEDFGNITFNSLKNFSGLLRNEAAENATITRTALELTADPERPLNIVLLDHLRRAYLSNVKANYFHHIECGRLPRHSHSAQVLLNSISAVLDRPDPSELGDFELVEEELTSSPLVKAFLVDFFDPLLKAIRIDYSAYAYREALYLKRAAYTWPSFVSAHEHALQNISQFLQDDISREKDARTIPEVRLIAERAEESIKRATQKMEEIGREEINQIYQKQAATAILNKEGELISKLAHEGLLSVRDAEVDLKRVINDIVNIETQRKELSRNLKKNFEKRLSATHIRMSAPVGESLLENDSMQPYNISRDTRTSSSISANLEIS